MEIRKASVQDLGQIMQVYDKARKFMRENGNAEQWGEDYPSAELIEHDIDKMYLCMSEGRIACVFYYAAEEDEDYKEILKDLFNNKMHKRLKYTLIEAVKRGISWWQIYIDNDGDLKARLRYATRIIPLWQDEEHEILDLSLIHI